MGSKERIEREKELRRNHIIEAAANEFIEKGFNAARMEDIAHRLEMTPGAIYTYFESKEELFVTLMRIPMDYLCDGVIKVSEDNSLSVEDKVSRLKDVIYDTFTIYPLMTRNIYHVLMESALTRLNPTLVQEIIILTRKLVSTMASIFEKGVSEGKFLKKKSVIYVDIFWGMFSGIVLWEESKKIYHPDKDFLKATFDVALEMFMKGIREKQ